MPYCPQVTMPLFRMPLPVQQLRRQMRLKILVAMFFTTRLAGALDGPSQDTLTALPQDPSPELPTLTCPMQFISVASEKGRPTVFEINQGALDYLGSLKPPFFWVPALGAFRGGKSMLLNRLRGLQSPYLEGFGVGHTRRTHTRGMLICGESVAEPDGTHLATVIWADTEGLDSDEIRRAGYSEKLSSLVLLLGSVVILNSSPVIRDSFCSDLCAMDRRLQLIRQELLKALGEHLEERARQAAVEAVQPASPTVAWLVQQLPDYANRTDVEVEVVQKYFGQDDPDPCRQSIRQRFSRHLYHEIPRAADDGAKLGELNNVADADLSPIYVEASAFLRRRLLGEVRDGTSKRFEDTGAMLEMVKSYVNFVNSDAFDPKSFVAAHEKKELAKACEEYGRQLLHRAGSLPAPEWRLKESETGAYTVLSQWKKRAPLFDEVAGDAESLLKECVQRKQEELKQKNAAQLGRQLSRWLDHNATGYFMSSFRSMLHGLAADHGDALSLVQGEAMERARSLQPRALAAAVNLRGLGLLSGPQRLLLLMWLSPTLLLFSHAFNRIWFWGLVNLGWQPVFAAGAGVWWLLDFQFLQESSGSLAFLATVLGFVCDHFSLVFLMTMMVLVGGFVLWSYRSQGGESDEDRRTATSTSVEFVCIAAIAAVGVAVATACIVQRAALFSDEKFQVELNRLQEKFGAQLDAVVKRSERTSQEIGESSNHLKGLIEQVRGSLDGAAVVIPSLLPATWIPRQIPSFVRRHMGLTAFLAVSPFIVYYAFLPRMFAHSGF